MKKVYQSKILFTFLSLAVIILLIFLHNFELTKPLDITITWLLNPITRGFYSLGLKTNKYFIQKIDIDLLKEENQKLNDEINKLLIEKSKLIKQYSTLQEMSQQFNYAQNNQLTIVSAEVIGLNITTESHIYIINKGESDDIKNNYPVIINNGILVGKIIETGPKISKLRLITDSQSIISGEIQNEQNSLGVITGELGLSLKMTLIPQTDTIEPNQLVITSGLDLNIPRGLLVAKIDKLTTQTGELFQSASLDLINDLEKINTVSIILPSYD